MKIYFLGIVILALAACRPHGMNTQGGAYGLQSSMDEAVVTEGPPVFEIEFFSDEAKELLDEAEAEGHREPVKMSEPLPENSSTGNWVSPVNSNPPPETGVPSDDSSVKPAATGEPPARRNSVSPVRQPSPPAPSPAPTPAPAPTPSPETPAAPESPNQGRVPVDQNGKPSDIRRDHESAPLPDPSANSKDFVAKGKVVPSIYYKPLLIEDERTCPSGSKVNLSGTRGQVLIKVCRATFSKCLMEGSCRISQNGIERSFNVIDTGSRPTFVEILDEDCIFGLGVRGICLDPFYTVAADMRHRRAGDVIYVPALVGQVLPNGEKHNGFLVVRDRGGAILGAHRFDFFSGSIEWMDPRNTFTKLKLNDKRTRLDYYLVTGESAKKILKRRAFPKIPHSH